MEDKPSPKRDDYFRCPVCKQLFEDKLCVLDPVKGFICPNNCERSFEQPPYESPFGYETTSTQNEQ